MTKPFLQPNCYKCGVLLDIVIELYIKYLPCWFQCSVQRNVRTFGVLRRPLTTEQLANLTMCEPLTADNGSNDVKMFPCRMKYLSQMP